MMIVKKNCRILFFEKIIILLISAVLCVYLNQLIWSLIFVFIILLTMFELFPEKHHMVKADKTNNVILYRVNEEIQNIPISEIKMAIPYGSSKTSAPGAVLLMKNGESKDIKCGLGEVFELSKYIEMPKENYQPVILLVVVLLIVSAYTVCKLLGM